MSISSKDRKHLLSCFALLLTTFYNWHYLFFGLQLYLPCFCKRIILIFLSNRKRHCRLSSAVSFSCCFFWKSHSVFREIWTSPKARLDSVLRIVYNQKHYSLPGFTFADNHLHYRREIDYKIGATITIADISCTNQIVMFAPIIWFLLCLYQLNAMLPRVIRLSTFSKIFFKCFLFILVPMLFEIFFCT